MDKTKIVTTDTIEGADEQRGLFDNKIGDERFVSTRELAQRLGVSHRTVEGWRYRGLITPIKVGPRLVRYDLDEVIEQMSSEKGGI